MSIFLLEKENPITNCYGVIQDKLFCTIAWNFIFIVDYLCFFGLLGFWLEVGKSRRVENNISLHHRSNLEKMKAEVGFETSPLREINWSLPSDSRRMDNKARESQKDSPCKVLSFVVSRRIYGPCLVLTFSFLSCNFFLLSPSFHWSLVRVTAWTKRSFVELREKSAPVFGVKNYGQTDDKLKEQVTRWF